MSTTVPSGGTHYQLLGVAPTASVDEIRAAYRRLARALHPDAHGGVAAPAMASVNEAWRVLSDPGRRANYDATLRGGPPRLVPSEAAEDDEPAEHLEDDWDEVLDPEEARAARRLAVVLAVTIVVVLVLLAALFFYAFTRSGRLPPARSGLALPVLVG